MTGFDAILDQNRPIRLLTTLYLNNAVPHALLFTGIDGVGKKTCAILFAMLCNCPNPDKSSDISYAADHYVNPCRSCRSCRKIQSGNHPDILIINPSGRYIKIDRIRELCRIIAMKPYEARFRVVIISDAEKMTPEAVNALLKELEEPPAKTIFILTALQKADLIPTIVSRCQTIRFNPISLNNISAMLVNKNGIDHDDAMIIAAMANGSLSKALSTSSPRNRAFRINYRMWLISVIDRCINFNLSSSTLLAIAARLSKNREVLSDSLEMIISWLRDLIIWKFYPEKVINIDQIERIQNTSKGLTIKFILSKVKAVQTAQKMITENVNLRLTAETLLFKISNSFLIS